MTGPLVRPGHLDAALDFEKIAFHPEGLLRYRSGSPPPKPSTEENASAESKIS
jgi:hypothetical protein